ncbi:permease prefix domain 1-containing protein [Sphaerisporangium perillae]|uniref:permease prefix domain 1-containing protein n=1 Tax=Sphaerisporangium perillae TaxID=2935860 RepID=UPI00200F5731|nr:permease prefix domain 1-containing protein [Sphaerisporangium perillae]
MASASVIDDYVATLDRTLRGPARVRRDMVTEARDSLADTADAYLAEGVDRAEAERMAVAEFGPVRVIAPGYQEELAAHQGRRTAAVLFITVPLLTVMWSGIWKIFPEPPPAAMAAKPAWFTPLSHFLDWFQLCMGVVGALALLTLGRPPRRMRHPGLVTRALGILVWIQVPAVLLMSAALSAGNAAALRGFSDYPPGAVASTLSYLVAGWLLYSATRCLIASRPLPMAPTVRRQRVLG